MSARDKVALITGATGALGQATVRVFAEAGAWLALTARSKERLEELGASLGLSDDCLLIHAADVTDATLVNELVEQTVAHFGRIDALLHIAGGYRGGKTVVDTELADLDFMLTLNLRSVFLVCQAVLPHMVEQGWGRIVAVGARTAVRPTRRSGVYAASKAGLIALIETIATEVKGQGITANVVLPSTIDTPTNRQFMPKADFSKWVPPKQIAHAMLYLCSDEAASINGARIPVYGGG